MLMRMWTYSHDNMRNISVISLSLVVDCDLLKDKHVDGAVKSRQIASAGLFFFFPQKFFNKPFELNYSVLNELANLIDECPMF